jgi:hypothetical protein
MNIAQSTAQFAAGLRNIESAIIAKVREGGATISAENFKWNRGRDVISPPRDAIELEIATNGKSFVTHLSYEQVLDSWRQVVRPDVVAGIRNAVTALTN